jgi:hypothetical protein
MVMSPQVSWSVGGFSRRERSAPYLDSYGPSEFGSRRTEITPNHWSIDAHGRAGLPSVMKRRNQVDNSMKRLPIVAGRHLFSPFLRRSDQPGAGGPRSDAQFFKSSESHRASYSNVKRQEAIIIVVAVKSSVHLHAVYPIIGAIKIQD